MNGRLLFVIRRNVRDDVADRCLQIGDVDHANVPINRLFRDDQVLPDHTPTVDRRMDLVAGVADHRERHIVQIVDIGRVDIVIAELRDEFLPDHHRPVDIGLLLVVSSRQHGDLGPLARLRHSTDSASEQEERYQRFGSLAFHRLLSWPAENPTLRRQNPPRCSLWSRHHHWCSRPLLFSSGHRSWRPPTSRETGACRL